MFFLAPVPNGSQPDGRNGVFDVSSGPRSGEIALFTQEGRNQCEVTNSCNNRVISVVYDAWGTGIRGEGWKQPARG